MRTVTALISLYVLLNAALASAQPAESPIVKTVTAEQVSTTLQEAGYRVVLATASDGSKYLKIEMLGIKYVNVIFLGCTKDYKCIGLRYFVVLAKEPSYTVDLANTINSTQFAAKAYVREDGNFVIQLDLDIDGGTTLENIKQNANLFQTELKDLLNPSK
jgi:Putative bacterial sensory transduction regulator